MSQLKALGGLRLEPTGVELAPFTQPKPLLLLSYVSLEGIQSRRHLAELFWQDGNRMKSLSMTLTRLRQGAGDVVEVDERQVKAALACDARALLESLDKSNWQKADELYTGAFLEGVVLEDWSTELEEWVYTTREYLAERVQYALLNLAEESAKKQDFRTSTKLAERAYKLPGLSGTEILALKRLYPLLTAGQSMLAPEARKEAESYGLTLRLTSDEARTAFKEGKTSTLPVRGTSFIGRDEELTELATLLSKPSLSLLTLLGPAGVGKTRLALQFAFEQQKLGAFKDGVYFAPLDTLNDANLLAPSLVSYFGLSQQGKKEPFTQLTEFLADKHLLLVLDNFEQLTEGSGLVSDLLASCPNLNVLVTSREKLCLEEEHLFVLTGLPFANTRRDEITLSESVQLFSERAQQVQPHFDVNQHLSDVLRICELVEGLPLGLELAASWVRLMSCQEIAVEIERGLELFVSDSKNVPERHRSLKAAFEQSWKLLTLKEQAVLRNLSVFVGGFRREAATGVAGATIPVLASLVDKSLLKVLQNGRYDRHPLLYQFTREKLSEQPDRQLEVQERHARYYLAFAELADSHLQGREQVSWFGQLDEELENLREALTFLETHDVLPALQLAASLGYFWNTRGYYGEGVGHLTMLLTKTSGHTFVRANAYLRVGDLLWKQAEHVEAQTAYEQGLVVADHLRHYSLKARIFIGLGLIAKANRGDYEGARSQYQSALELAKASGDKACTAAALRHLGILSGEQGNYQDAKRCHETSAQLYAELSNFHDRAKTLINLATVLTDLGRSREAHALNVETLELFRTVGDRRGTAIALLNLGLDYEGSDRQKGNEFYAESLQLCRDLGDKQMVSHLLNNLAGNFQKLGELAKAQSLLEESLVIQQGIGDVSLIAHALYILGQVRQDLGEFQRARQTYNECAALCRKNDDNWTLMRVLEASATLHMRQRDYECAKAELNEAFVLAEQAGDQKTLQKILELVTTCDTPEDFTNYVMILPLPSKQ